MQGRKQTSGSNTSDKTRRRNNKRLRNTAQLTPVIDSEEHDAVGRALISVSQFAIFQQNSDNNNSNCHIVVQFTVEEALERVAVWKLRSSKISHAVESTAALAQILYRDNTQSSSTTTTTTTTTTELRYAYSCAVLRAINGLADTLQQQRSMASSVAVLCTELGVPSWLVSIRHEATHNQLPSLPTLRMAANALIQYFATVYWEPMALRHQIAYYHQAYELLQNYEDAMIDELNHKQFIQQQNKELRKQQQQLSEGTTVNDNGDEEESEDETTTLPIIDGLLQSVPGTTANRFALLQRNPKANKRKRNLSPNNDASLNAHNNSKAVKTATSSTTNDRTEVVTTPVQLPVVNQQKALMWARMYVNLTMIPVDVAYKAALSVLVIGTTTTTSTGKLATENDFAMCCEKYRLLLTIIIREWPGFLTALLQSCVQLLVSTERRTMASSSVPSDSSSSSRTIISNLELWIRYLLSRKFIYKVDSSFKAVSSTDDATTTVTTGNTAPLSVYKTLRIPLNRLCDYLMKHNEEDITATQPKQQQSSASQRVLELLTKVLGNERCFNSGIVHYPVTTVETPTPRMMAQVTPPLPLTENDDNNEEAATSERRPTLSLEAMEALLSVQKAPATKGFPGESMERQQHTTGETRGAMHTTTTTTMKTKIPPVFWEPCESWEPCAIGTFL